MTNIGIDGFNRSKDNDEMISNAVGSCFATPIGQEVLKYLKSITIEMVGGPDITDAKLRHLEGQRYIVGLIERRIVHNHGVKQNGRSDTDSGSKSGSKRGDPLFTSKT
jgi:hypothetical protein|tara:strand:- start:46 stop:369 length:324 start_codon:yes stop_codon:yes gene_type:complete